MLLIYIPNRAVAQETQIDVLAGDVEVFTRGSIVCSLVENDDVSGQEIRGGITGSVGDMQFSWQLFDANNELVAQDMAALPAPDLTNPTVFLRAVTTSSEEGPLLGNDILSGFFVSPDNFSTGLLVLALRGHVGSFGAQALVSSNASPTRYACESGGGMIEFTVPFTVSFSAQ